MIARFCSAGSASGGAPAAFKAALGNSSTSRTAAVTMISTPATRRIRISLERESKLQGQRIRPGLLTQRGVIILQLQGDGFAGIEAQASRRAGAQPNIRKDRLGTRSGYVLAPEVGAIG